MLSAIKVDLHLKKPFDKNKKPKPSINSVSIFPGSENEHSEVVFRA